MLPLPLKRDHSSGAHTAEDVDQTLNAARDVLGRMRADGLFARAHAAGAPR